MIPRARLGGWAVVLNIALLLVILKGGTSLLVSSLTVQDQPTGPSAHEVLQAARHQRQMLWQAAPELKRANSQKEWVTEAAEALAPAASKTTTTQERIG